MAYTIVPTITTGDIATAAWGNTHIKDNFAAVDTLIDLQTASFTDGGILLGSGASALTAMAVLADGSIVVGDGATDPVVLAAFTNSTGTLKHESGGIEADISAVVLGGLLAGTGTNTIGLLGIGTNNQILVADSGEAAGMKWAANPAGKINTGTYTGDGATSQGITGVGFQPKMVWISKRQTTDNTQFGSGEHVWTSDVIVDDIAAGAAINMSTGITNGNHKIMDNAIISLDSDGFTVDDDSGDEDPNANTIVYNYLAFG